MTASAIAAMLILSPGAASAAAMPGLHRLSALRPLAAPSAVHYREYDLPAGRRVGGVFDDTFWLDVWYIPAYAGQTLTFTLTNPPTGNCYMSLWESTATASAPLAEGPTQIVYTIPPGTAPSWYDIDIESDVDYFGPYTMTYSIGDPPITTPIARLAGEDRYSTAIQVSGTFASADTVVICSGANFPDALAASGLAGCYGAPVLLTRKESLPPGLAEEIARLGATKAFLVGSTAVISADVADELATLGMTVQRIAGPDRYATAAAVSAEIREHEGTDFSGRAFVARGDTFPDALSAAPLAYALKAPILLVKKDSLPTPTSNELAAGGFNEVHVTGSNAAISDATFASIAVASKDRIFGADRYSTSAAIANYAASHGWTTASRVGVATGEDFPDALGGAAWAGAEDGTILLTRHNYMPTSTFTSLASSSATSATVFGGNSVVFGTVLGDLDIALQ